MCLCPVILCVSVCVWCDCHCHCILRMTHSKTLSLLCVWSSCLASFHNENAMSCQFCPTCSFHQHITSSELSALSKKRSHAMVHKSVHNNQHLTLTQINPCFIHCVASMVGHHLGSHSHCPAQKQQQKQSRFRFVFVECHSDESTR